MNIYDISLPVSGDLPVWPGDPPVTLERAGSIKAGASANVTRIELGSHAGTHIDAPHHFFEQGRTADAISLEACIGPCLVLEHGPETPIEREDLDFHDLEGCERILFKTRNSDRWARGTAEFTEDYVSLGMSAAVRLVEKKIVLVGVDYLSIEAFIAPGNPVHSILLENEIVIVEGLNLSAVKPGRYELICLPLKIVGSDGAPARAVLRGR
jgi:arylformamidase